MSDLHPLDADGVEQAVADALAAFDAATTLDELKEARLAHTGDKAALTLANRGIGALDGPDKATAGKLLGGARATIGRALAARTEVLEAERDARVLVEEAVDVTLPVLRAPLGARHPLETLQEHMCDIFVGMGWEVAEGPEVEAEWFNFDALNFDPDHPARAMQDTFFVAAREGDNADAAVGESGTSGIVLRTHTSPVQMRAALGAQGGPRKEGRGIYVICPGKTFRTDELDATHTPVFHQIEGLAVDKGLTHGAPQGHAGPLCARAVRARCRDALAPVVLPVHRAVARRWTCGASCAAARTPRAARAAAPAGSSGAAAA